VQQYQGDVQHRRQSAVALHDGAATDVEAGVAGVAQAQRPALVVADTRRIQAHPFDGLPAHRTWEGASCFIELLRPLQDPLGTRAWV